MDRGTTRNTGFIAVLSTSPVLTLFNPNLPELNTDASHIGYGAVRLQKHRCPKDF
jgi:hypothetical protein